MNSSEAIAKKLIEEIIPGAQMVYNHNQSSSQYDFNLIFHNNTTAALEVTVSTKEYLTKTIASIKAKRKGGSIIQAVKCKYGWTVDPLPNAIINDIRKRVDEYIAAIEFDDLDKFYAPIDAIEHSTVKDIYEDLKILSGNIINKSSKFIIITTPSVGGEVNEDNLLKAVENEANKKDNINKLKMATTIEKHLFIYIDENNYLPSKAMCHGLLPTHRPNITNIISDIWVATSVGYEYLVWKFNPNSGWKNFGSYSGI